MVIKPTEEQKDIRDHGAGLQPGNHLKVCAFAGSGKSSTLKIVAGAIPHRGCYLAFNKAIADEAKRKLAATRCSASTMHSLAYAALREEIGSPVQLNARAFRDSGIGGKFRVPRVPGWNDFRIASAVSRTLQAFCASDDGNFTEAHGREALIASVGDPEMIKDRARSEEASFALDSLAPVLTAMARAWWDHCVRERSYSHDMYLKAIDLDEGLRRDAFRGFRYAMVDEAQDLNPVQRSILTKTGLSLIAVGDPYQQIYSWRGAENALDLLPGETKYLTASFRFGEGIAALARRILASRPDGGPSQRLVGAGTGDITNHRGAAAAIICRTNFGMIEEALNLARKGITFHVDNMSGLLADVRSAQALFEGRLQDVTTADLRPFASWSELTDQAEEDGGALSRLVTIVEDDRVREIERLGERQVEDPAGARVMVCTAHRSKGLEWPAVKLGGDWKDLAAMEARYRKSRKMSAGHQILAIEEWNALYVASTRPMTRLVGLEPLFDRDRDLAPQDP